MKLFFRRLIGKITRFLFPGYGCCGRCGRPWKVAKYHVTDYTAGRGCFPLCQECWSELTIGERVLYYCALVVSWMRHGDEDDAGIPWIETWKAIKDAVLQGK